MLDNRFTVCLGSSPWRIIRVTKLCGLTKGCTLFPGLTSRSVSRRHRRRTLSRNSLSITLTLLVSGTETRIASSCSRCVPSRSCSSTRTWWSAKVWLIALSWNPTSGMSTPLWPSRRHRWRRCLAASLCWVSRSPLLEPSKARAALERCEEARTLSSPPWPGSSTGRAAVSKTAGWGFESPTGLDLPQWRPALRPLAMTA